jgi:hypothetical protein
MAVLRRAEGFVKFSARRFARVGLGTKGIVDRRVCDFWLAPSGIDFLRVFV